MTRVVALLSVLLLCQTALSQKLLDRLISIEATNVNSYQFLDQLSVQEEITFAYNPRDFNPDSIFGVSIENTQMKQALTALFRSRFEYREYKDHVLFLKKRREKTREKRVIRGYLVNVETGEFINVGSVSELGKLNSTLSNDEGFYEIELPSEYDSYGLVVSKYGFQDTILVIDESVEVIDIKLKPLSPSQLPPSRLTSKGSESILAPQINLQHARNYVSPFYRFAQFSFLPFLGTNLALSGVVSNSISLNLIGGYSFSTTGVELGGLFNIDRKGMFGLQVAGWSNINGGKVAGLQLAGITNINTGITNAVQFAGIYNNATGSFKGLQASGIANLSVGGGTSMQVSGIVNVSARGKSLMQLSGIHNFADTSYLQLTGIANTALENRGLQVGLLNTAKTLSGVQIGLVNLSIDGKGVPVGMFSYSRYGYNSIDAVFDETLFSTLRFSTGVNAFYNIFQLSWNPFNDSYAYGLGFGTRWNFDRYGIESNVHFSQVNEGQFVRELNGLIGVATLFRYSLGRFQIAGGPEFKFMSSDWMDNDGNYLTNIAPYTLNEWVYNRTFHQTWVGGNIIIKIILHE